MGMAQATFSLISGGGTCPLGRGRACLSRKTLQVLVRSTALPRWMTCCIFSEEKAHQVGLLLCDLGYGFTGLEH